MHVGSLNLAVAEKLGIDFKLSNLGQFYNRKETIVKSQIRQTMPLFNEMLDLVELLFEE